MAEMSFNTTGVLNDSPVLYMKKVIADYERLRGRSKHDFHCPFWDAVAISAADITQKKIFDTQIKNKIHRRELPLDIPFHVFDGPAGVKIGCGGATFQVLDEMFSLYGDHLFQLKILVIHAGGLSQRLPSHSVMGKLFSPLPMGNPMFQMLDILLAIYLPFLKRMQPGAFIASSDAVITYFLPENDESVSWSFEKSGFTALAHPSSLAVGTKHGVYILHCPSGISPMNHCFMTPCLEVLQKPSLQLMKERGATIKFPTQGNEEFVFSDSAFFFDSSVILKMLNFYKTIKPIKCEISSYGDFLQPLGPRASMSYIKNTDHVRDVTDDLIPTREKIYHLLKDTPLNIVALQSSAFYHLGTMQEYIENLSMNERFIRELGLSKFICSAAAVEGVPLSGFKGVVMHSVMHPSSHIAEASIIEYCDFTVAMHIEEKCILSCCHLSGSHINKVPVVIPSNSLFYTVPVTVNNLSGFVTVAFRNDDDLKKKFALSEAGNLKYFGMCLKDIIQIIFQFENASQIFDKDLTDCSLWKAKLFQFKPTMEESFLSTLELVQSVHARTPYSFTPSKNNELFSQKNHSVQCSVDDVLLHKDVDKLLQYHNRLLSKIQVVECGTV